MGLIYVFDCPQLSELQRRSHSKAMPPAALKSSALVVVQQPHASPAAILEPLTTAPEPTAAAAGTGADIRPQSAVQQRQQAHNCAAELFRSSSAGLASPQLASGEGDECEEWLGCSSARV
jgi:hypothetical protein